MIEEMDTATVASNNIFLLFLLFHTPSIYQNIIQLSCVIIIVSNNFIGQLRETRKMYRFWILRSALAAAAAAATAQCRHTLMSKKLYQR